MLVICSGPNTSAASKRAAELVSAFKSKYDNAGFSVQVFDDPKMVDVLNCISAPSFFAPKRMIRADGLIDASKIADVRALSKRLAADGGQTVVLTCEPDIVSQKIIDEFAKGDAIQYSHPLLKGVEFISWCVKRATMLGVNIEIAKKIAAYTADDVWSAEQELQKASANPALFIDTREDSMSAYDRADRYVRSQTSWKEQRESVDDELMAILMSQARSAVRVRDGATEGVHPYAVKKLSGVRNPQLTSILMRTLKAHAATRSGFSDISEVETLL